MSGDPSFRFYKRSALITSAVLTVFIALISSGVGGSSSMRSGSPKALVVNADGSYAAVLDFDVTADQTPLGKLSVVVEARWTITGVSVNPIVTFVAAFPDSPRPPQEVIDSFASIETRSAFASPRADSLLRSSEVASLTTRPRYFVRWVGATIYFGALLAFGGVVYWLTFLRDRARWHTYKRRSLAAFKCPYCEYSLAGLNSATCPECGNEVVESRAT